jgi:Skp1 family, tetramerisation domain
VIVKLTSVDDFTFELPLEACKASQLCRDALPEDPDETLDAVEPIQLLRVGKRALEKVVDFLKHHHEEPLQEIPNPLRHGTFDEVSE